MVRYTDVDDLVQFYPGGFTGDELAELDVLADNDDDLARQLENLGF